MANQPQPRPWFRLGTLARAAQPPPPEPAPAPAPRAQMLQPPAPLPRPAMLRPTFRPPGTQPQPAQGAAPPPQTPRAPAPPPSAPGPPSRSLTTATVVPPPPAPVVVSPPSPPKPSPTIATTPAVAGPPPSSGVSPPSPPAPRPAIRSPVVQKSPPAPKTSPMSTTLPSPSLPSSPKPKSQTTTPSIPSSPVVKQAVARSLPASPSPPPKPSSPSSPSKHSSPSSPSKHSSPSPAPNRYSPSPKQVMPASPAKSSNDLATSARSPHLTSLMPPSVASPRAAKPLPETPPQSPKIKSVLAPPSPYKLPPSQLESMEEHERIIPAEAEQKSVLHVRKTVGKAGSFLDSYGGDSWKPQIGMYEKPKEREIYKKSSDSEDIGMRVITISGENKGAIMELGYSPRRPGNPHGPSVINHQKVKSDGELSDDNLSGNEGRSKMHGRGHNSSSKPSTPMHAYMNSNVQGINSSIVFNSTFSHHDPGVHLSLTRKPYNGHFHGNQFKDHSNGKSTYQKDDQYSKVK